MEHKDTYNARQEARPCPETGQNITRLYLILNWSSTILFFSTMPRTSDWYPSLRFPFQILVCNYTFCHRYTAPTAIFFFNFHNSSNFCSLVSHENLHSVNSSSQLLVASIQPRHFPRHSPLEWPQSVFFPVNCITQ